jgi:hypothetical protein
MSMNSPLFGTLQRAFAQRGWHCEPVAGREVVEAFFEAHHTRVRVHAQVFPDIRAVSVVGYATAEVPSARAGLIAEALMRLNQQLTLGNFEMDYDAGRVFFRVTNLFGSEAGDASIVASMVHAAVAEIDRLTPFLTLLLRMEASELARLNLRLFLQREDLLPPVAADGKIL